MSTNERNETRNLYDLPPSYRELLRRQENANNSDLSLTNNSAISQNLNYLDCKLCGSCHNHTRHIIRLLNRLCITMQSFSVNVTAFLNLYFILTFFFAMGCVLYLCEERIVFFGLGINDVENIIGNLNISVETRKIIVNNAKKILHL